MTETVIEIPDRFDFKDCDVFNFDRAIGVFDWSTESRDVLIDFSNCHTANYQALSLVVLYIWRLHFLCGCRIDFRFSNDDEGASRMWRLMGANEWHRILTNKYERFKESQFEPLIALRETSDFRLALSRAEDYTKNFDIEYEKTLRYVVSELMYNTLEHGGNHFKYQTRDVRLPSIIQFSWHQKRDEFQFLIGDLGMGIKKHLEQTYEPFEDHVSAIQKAIEPKVSGTFGHNEPYGAKNNAGFGLYLSSNIVKRLSAEMHIISGNGLVHISPTDITSRLLNHHWPGTFYVVNIHLSRERSINLGDMMVEFRELAARKIRNGEHKEEKKRHYLSVDNLFGCFAEDKEAAIKYRDKYLLPATERGEDILMDFSGVTSAPHSFLNALLAAVIQEMGMQAYKKIRIVNTEKEIRETIDFILDENT